MILAIQASEPRENKESVILMSLLPLTIGKSSDALPSTAYKLLSDVCSLVLLNSAFGPQWVEPTIYGPFEIRREAAGANARFSGEAWSTLYGVQGMEYSESILKEVPSNQRLFYGWLTSLWFLR